MTTRPVERLLSRLDGTRETGPGRWMARCPAHNDGRPSLSVREVEDGLVLVHCFAWCSVGSVVAAVGLDLSDLFPPTEAWRETDTARTTRYTKRRAPKIPAADALEALDLSAWVGQIVIEKVAAGEPLTEAMLQDLRGAARRIHAVRTAWGMQ